MRTRTIVTWSVALLLFLIAAFAAATMPPANTCPLDPETKLITYQGVVPAEGVSAIELYSRAKLWIANAYHSAKAVIDLDDKEGGRLVVKGTFTLSAGLMGSPQTYRHQLPIEVKDGRFRYRLTNLTKLQPGTPVPEWPLEGSFKEPFVGKKTWERIDAECRGTVESLIKSMGQPAAADKW
jgi:hypothetical protein